MESDEMKDSDRSDFMEEIRREVELKATLKKSTGPMGFYQEGQKTCLFNENFRKRSSARE
jgi:hypothetical protein